MKRSLAYITAAWRGDPAVGHGTGGALLPRGLRCGVFPRLPHALSAAVPQ